MNVSLKDDLLKAEPPYTQLAMRLLFCTNLHAGRYSYRIREIEMYAEDDPYTHRGDEQVSTCGGWYFHRTKPCGGWKGGTFMGLDLSFAPVGKAGGILIRGISRIATKDLSAAYIDGSCNCVREILRACGVEKIRDLVKNPAFNLDAFKTDGILRLEVVEEPTPPVLHTDMQWKATSRVGLSEPDKKPDQKNERKKYHKAPFRFLSQPFETKKEKTNIKNSTIGGQFSKKLLKEISMEQTLSSTLAHDTVCDDTKLCEKDHKNVNKENASWQYWLQEGMDGKEQGWHNFDKRACLKLEGFRKDQGERFSMRTWHLKSGFFSYEVDTDNMTQKNIKTGTIRPIRRVVSGEINNMQDSHAVCNISSSAPSSKKLKAESSPSMQVPKKKIKLGDLKLEPLFSGKHGFAWEGVLSKVLESQSRAADFIGPNRAQGILPVREMTFRALMALPPELNNCIVFGQAPYPRVESASGIAMFDSLIKDWNCSQFGKTVSMRCIAKAAAISKGIISQNDNIQHLRKAFEKHDIVSPPEWFQAMLAQGVLFLNAALTNGIFTTAEHTKFWMPIMQSIIRTILESKKNKFSVGAPQRRVAFLWWGAEALKIKKSLAHVLADYEDAIEIINIKHFNPAAQGDQFVKAPNHFSVVNGALVEGNLAPIDWLPNKTWLKEHDVDDHAAFITATQELHKLYLDRLQSGLDIKELPPITGIMSLKLCSLTIACCPIGLESAASLALDKVQNMTDSEELTTNEKASIYLYTTNILYRRLNEALRHPNRSKVMVYFAYLRLFLEAHAKLKTQARDLYRGINRDLSSLYAVGTMVTWWTISSCTPKIETAKAFGGGLATGTLFHVRAKSAVPILHLSAYKSEEEYILAPGTVLKVTNVIRKPGCATQIYLEEIKGKRLVE